MKSELQKGGAEVYEFGEYRIEAATRLLLCGGQPVSVTPKAFDTLLYLIQHSDRVIGKEELMRALWPDTVVEENNLNQNISTLRRALQQTLGNSARSIVTVPGSGYRFVADVRAVAHPDSLVQTLAVLPFRPVVEQNRNEALELGMADTLIARLSGISPRLVVRPLSSVRRYSDLHQDSLAAARDVEAEAVLEGSIQRQGLRIRVNARLLQVETGTAIWTQSFDESFTDVFGVQDRIAERVASALSVQLFPDQKRRSSRGRPQNVEAYHLFLQGRYHLERTVRPSILKAIDFFNQAIALDPLYGLAYSSVADAYRRLPITSDVPATDAFPKSRAAALRALEIDDELAEAHTWLGFIKMWFEWDWAGAESEMQRGIALDPQSGYARMAYQHLLTQTGRHQEALAEGTSAIDLEPLSLIVNANHGWALFVAGRVEEAIAQTEKTLDLYPYFWVAHLNRGKLHVATAEYAQALRSFQKAHELSGGNTEALSMSGYASALAGDEFTGRKMLETLRSRAPNRYTPPYNIAVILNGLGETEDALEWLERAVAERDVHLVFLKRDTKWEAYRQKPRFKRILKRLSLE